MNSPRFIVQVPRMPDVCPLAPLCDGTVVETTPLREKRKRGLCTKCGAEIESLEPAP